MAHEMNKRRLWNWLESTIGFYLLQGQTISCLIYPLNKFTTKVFDLILVIIALFNYKRILINFVRFKQLWVKKTKRRRIFLCEKSWIRKLFLFVRKLHLHFCPILRDDFLTKFLHFTDSKSFKLTISDLCAILTTVVQIPLTLVS